MVPLELVPVGERDVLTPRQVAENSDGDVERSLELRSRGGPRLEAEHLLERAEHGERDAQVGLVEVVRRNVGPVCLQQAHDQRAAVVVVLHTLEHEEVGVRQHNPLNVLSVKDVLGLAHRRAEALDLARPAVVA
eukprot:5824252-Pleurochrysis_carterae.AAC.2